jgi:hypothetical protein
MEFHRFAVRGRWSSIAWGGFDGVPSVSGMAMMDFHTILASAHWFEV